MSSATLCMQTMVEQLSLEKIELLLQSKILSAEQIQKMFIDEKNLLRRRDVLELLANSIRDCCTSSDNGHCQTPASDCKADTKSPVSNKNQNATLEFDFNEPGPNKSTVSKSSSDDDNSNEDDSSKTNCGSDGNVGDPVLKTSSSFTTNTIPDVASRMLSLQSQSRLAQSLTLQTSLQVCDPAQNCLKLLHTLKREMHEGLPEVLLMPTPMHVRRRLLENSP